MPRLRLASLLAELTTGLTTGLATGLPARCEVCRTWPSRPICADCARECGDTGRGIQGRCARCALPLASPPCVARPSLPTTPSTPGPDTPEALPLCGACRLRPPPLDACACALPYDFPWDGLIARFKFGGEPGLARPLAGLLRQQPQAAALVDAADWVLPLPLAPRRLAERGYNQALALARQLAPGRRLAPRLLHRVRETPPQASLDRAARARNLRQAFEVDPAQAATIRGRRLLLVDDVMTSGATLHEAARTLRRAGAAHVAAVVLARTELP